LLLETVAACERELAKEEEKRRQQIETPGGINTESRWVRFMQWADHLQGKDRNLLSKAGQLPMTAAAAKRSRDREGDRESRRLRPLVESFQRELLRCTARLEQVPADTLKWLASIDPSKPAGDPFRMKQEATTTDWYSSCWQRYVCYCVRVWPLGRDGAKAEYGIRFSEAQWAALTEVVERLDVVAVAAAAAAAAEEEAEEAEEKEEEEAEDLDKVVLDRSVF
jgi:hypothetical protein